MVSDDDHKSWGSPQRKHTPDAPPIWTPSSPQLPALPTSERHVGIPVTPECEEEMDPSLASRDYASKAPHFVPSSRSSQIVDLPLPVFARITLPRFSLSPSGIDKMLERQLASSEPGNDRNDTEFGHAAPDRLPDGLLSIAQNGEFYSTGNCCSKRIWNCVSLTIIFYSLLINIKLPHRFPTVGLYRCHQWRARMFVGQCLRILSV